MGVTDRGSWRPPFLFRRTVLYSVLGLVGYGISEPDFSNEIMPTQQSIDLANRHVATHEAGHAVMLALMHIEQPAAFPLPWYAEIKPGANGLHNGRVGCKWARRDDKRIAILHGLIAVAGALAESIEFGRCGRGYEKEDLPYLHRVLDGAGYGASEKIPLIDLLMSRATELLSRQNVRIATRQVAAELLDKRRLTGEDILRIVTETEEIHAPI